MKNSLSDGLMMPAPLMATRQLKRRGRHDLLLDRFGGDHDAPVQEQPELAHESFSLRSLDLWDSPIIHNVKYDPVNSRFSGRWATARLLKAIQQLAAGIGRCEISCIITQ